MSGEMNTSQQEAFYIVRPLNGLDTVVKYPIEDRSVEVPVERSSRKDGLKIALIDIEQAFLMWDNGTPLTQPEKDRLRANLAEYYIEGGYRPVFDPETLFHKG